MRRSSMPHGKWFRRQKCLVVGGCAVMKYREPFYTKDIDIWVEPENAKALVQFGAPLADHAAALRVNVMTTIDGATFADAWEQRVETQLGGVPISVISLADLIRNKEAAVRDSDRIHLDRLRRYGRESPPL
jgi:hypothetical protein